MNWNNLNLSGILNVTLLPRSLTKFTMSLNRISGIVDTAIPLNLTQFSIVGNNLSGQIPNLISDKLITINLSNNSLTSFPSNWPNNLVYLNLADNKFNTTIPQLPETLKELRLQGNLLSGPIAIPFNVTTLILGTLSSYTNKITGNITLNTPTLINLFGNPISNLFIQNSSLLTDCTIRDTLISIDALNITNCNYYSGVSTHSTQMSIMHQDSLEFESNSLEWDWETQSMEYTTTSLYIKPYVPRSRYLPKSHSNFFSLTTSLDSNTSIISEEQLEVVVNILFVVFGALSLILLLVAKLTFTFKPHKTQK